MSFTDLSLQKAELPNGVELNYVREGAGTPLIFIHGAMGDWRSWEPQWKYFTADYDCISYSRRYSHPNVNDVPSPNHSALVDAEDLEGLMDALGVTRAIIVGSSYGAFTALALAVRAPQRVLAIVGVEPPMMRYAYLTEKGAAVAEEFRTRTIEPANDAFRRNEDTLAARLMTSGIGGSDVVDMNDERMVRRMQNLKAMKMLALSQDEFPMVPRETLASLPMPILLMSGEETAPVHAAIFSNLTAAMPNAKSMKIAKAGHSVSAAQAEIFNREASAFIETALDDLPVRKLGS